MGNGTDRTSRPCAQPDDLAFLEECFRDPWAGEVKAVCNGTAIELIEINIRAIRETPIAGGVAFMLADTREEARDNFNYPDDCTISPEEAQNGENGDDLTFDYFTGLFATDSYCAGTFIRTAGSLKSTGYRVCLHHTNYAPSTGECILLTDKIFLPAVRRN